MVLLLVGARLAMGKNCEIVDQCSCQFDDGSGKVDLTSLGNKDSTPRFRSFYFVPTNCSCNIAQNSNKSVYNTCSFSQAKGTKSTSFLTHA